MIAALYHLAERGLTAPPQPAPGGAPHLAIRFHDLYGTDAPVWQVDQPAPSDPSYAEQEGRDALALYSLDRIRTHWYFPKDVDPELERIHEEEVREYAEEIVIFRLGALQQLDRTARATRLTFVVENTGDVPAQDQAAREDGWDAYEKHSDGSLTVTYRVDRVSPRAAPNLTKTSLMFRQWEDVAPLTIGWEVSAADPPTTSGSLTVAVRLRSP